MLTSTSVKGSVSTAGDGSGQAVTVEPGARRGALSRARKETVCVGPRCREKVVDGAIDFPLVPRGSVGGLASA